MTEPLVKRAIANRLAVDRSTALARSWLRLIYITTPLWWIQFLQHTVIYAQQSGRAYMLPEVGHFSGQFCRILWLAFNLDL